MWITFHLPTLSGDGRCCLYRLMYTILEHAAKGNKTETSVPSSTLQELGNISQWSTKQRVMPGEYFAHFFCRTLLPFWPQVHLLPCFSRREGLCKHQQAPNGPYLKNGCMGQRERTPRLQYHIPVIHFIALPCFKSAQWAVACFNLAKKCSSRVSMSYSEAIIAF